MYEPNVHPVLSRIGPEDIVLDIGGWARPFNRANYVLDAEPYKTRGYHGSARSAQGGEREYFSAATWIQRDICAREPFPFRDKEIDYCICSHTLEDIRDPLWVCSEMVRIARRGYIEVPSRLAESCRGWEHRRTVGLSHHRWLIDIDERGIAFLMKHHMIHSRRRFSLPPRQFRKLSERQQVQWLFWEGEFLFRETTIHGLPNIAAELSRFVQESKVASPVAQRAGDFVENAADFATRAIDRLERLSFI